MAANNNNSAVPASLVVAASNNHNPTYPNLATRLLGANSKFERDSQQLLRILFDNVQAVSQRVGNTEDTINTVTTTITKFTGGGGGGGGNNGNNEVYVAFGPHASRLGSTDAVLWIETDRNNSQYYFDGSQWNLVAAQWRGSFEDRYGDLGIPDTGAIWVETSRNNVANVPPLLEYLWNGNNWVYQSGAMALAQSQFANFSATLGQSDFALIVQIKDYHHQLKWFGSANNNSSYNNSGWNWGPIGDQDVASISYKVAPPSDAVSWVLCNGNSTTYLNADGTTTAFTTPNIVGAANGVYPKFGANYNGAIAPATSPMFTGTPAPVTGNVTANFNGTPGNITGNVNSTFNGTPANFNGNINVTIVPLGVIDVTTSNAVTVTPSNIGSGVAQQFHQHTFVGNNSNGTGNFNANYTPAGTVTSVLSGSNYTPAGTISANFNGNNFTPAGNISNNAEPAHFIGLPYFRR